MTILETIGAFALTVWFCRLVLWFGVEWDRMKEDRQG